MPLNSASDAVAAAQQLPLVFSDIVVGADEALRRIALADRIVPYLLRRGRRRTIALSVDDRGLRVSAPRRTSLIQIESVIHHHSAWIVNKLDEWRTRRRPQILVVADGMVLPCLGGELVVRLFSGPHEISWSDRELKLVLSPGSDPGACLEKALRARAAEHFAMRLKPLAALLGVSVPPLALSSARTRWGSCSSSGRVRLNWRLIHFSESIIDYVIVHELAHLRHMNHGPEFWALVASVVPDYRSVRTELQALAAHLPRWQAAPIVQKN